MKRPRVPHLTQTYIFWRVLSSICNRLDSTFLFPRFWSTSTLSKAVQRLTINTPPSHTRFHIVQVFSGCRVARASLSSPAYYPTTLVAWLCPASSTQSYRKWKKHKCSLSWTEIIQQSPGSDQRHDLCRSSPGKQEAHETCGNRTKWGIWCDCQNDGRQINEN